MSVHAIQIETIEPAPMTPKQASIVRAAATLFLDRGFGAVSMDAIAAEASASKRTVYSYYHNKQTLFADVMSMVCMQSGGQQGCPLVAENIIANEQITGVLQQTGEHVLNIISSPQTIELYRVVVAEAGRFPELGRSYYEMGPKWVMDRLAEYLRDLVAGGQANIEDPNCASRKFFGMVTFPIQMELMLGIETELSESRITEISKAAAAVFCGAYGISQKQ